MNEPTDITRAEHYTWGDRADGWRLVDSLGLSVIEERVPAGTGEEWHLHDSATQFFYVLEGEAQVQTAEGVVTLLPRQGVEIAAGRPHKLFNPGATENWFLVVSAPSTRGDRRRVDDPHSL